MFDNWDTAGQEVYGGLRDGYYIGANCAIIMFDVTAMATYNNVDRWYRDLTRVCDNIPIILVANKVDVKDRQVTTKKVSFHRRKNLKYLEISAKSNFNIDKPYLELLRALLQAPDVNLAAELAPLPPEQDVTPLTAQQQDEINMLIAQQNAPEESTF